MAQISFDQYKQRIQDAIQNKVIAKGIISGDPEGFILLDGFFNIPFQKELGGAFVIGGPTIPAVAIVGKSTGIIHTFAIKALLPDVQL